MKLLIFSTLFIALNCLAEQQESCDVTVSQQAIELATTFQPSHCLKGVTKVQLANTFTKDKDRNKVCANCESKLTNEKILDPDYKDAFIQATFDELRKSLSQLTLELVAVRSNKELKFSDESAVQACNTSQMFTKKDGECFDNPIIQNQVKELQSQIAREFSNTIQNNLSQPGLLDRNKTECSITDNAFLFSRNRYVESLLPTIISQLKGIDFEKTESVSTQLGSLLAKSNINLDIGTLLNHPIIAGLFSNPVQFKVFQESIKSTDTVDQIRNKLYDTKNADLYNITIAKRCTTYFSEIKSKLCSKEFAKNNFAVDTKSSLESVKKLDSSLSSASQDQKIEAMISYCQDIKHKNKDTILFSEIKANLNKDLNASLQDLTYGKYKIDAYKTNIMNPKDALCEIAKGTKACEEGTQACALYKQWKDSQNPGSETKNLLAAHDVNIDKILRSLIGEPKDLNDDTKKILIAEGILKTPEGTYNTKDTPERKTDYVSDLIPNSSANTTANMARATNTSAKPVKTTQPTTTEAQSPQISYPTDQTTSDTQPLPLSNSPSSSSDNEEIRNNLQKQILDRLGKQVTAKQIEDMVAKAYNKGRSTPMTQAQVEEKTKEVLEDMPTTIGGNSSGPGQVNAKISSDPNKAKKAQQLGFLKAKYGIDPTASNTKGSQAKAGGTDENLKVVAVTNADELKIIVGDLKNLKNAQIAELMQKQTPFILQIGNVPYKISFEKGQLNIDSPKNVARDPAAITKLRSYILNLAKTQKDNGLYKELRSLKYQE